MKKHRPLALFVLGLVTAILGSSLASCSYIPHGNGKEDADIDECRQIFFEGRRFTYTGEPDCVEALDDSLIIKRSGVYRLSGELTEGRVTVNCSDGGGVRLILDGAAIRSSYGPALHCEGATVLTVETLADTVNFLSSKAYRENDGELPTACILSECPLILCGEGTLIADTDSECGILSLGSMTLRSGSLTVNASELGVWVRDRFLQEGGRLTISYAKTGLLALGGELSTSEVRIIGGSFVALCDEVAIRAGRKIDISAGIGSIDAPTVYLCEREKEGKAVAGVINVTSPDFPKYKGQTKIKE